MSSTPNKFDPAQHQIDQALASLGLAKKNKIIDLDEDGEIKIPTVKEVFDSNGAGVEEAAMTIAGAMADASSPSMQLKAAELALRVHGIFKDAEDKGSKVPQINITINASQGSENKTLVQVLMPTP